MSEGNANRCGRWWRRGALLGGFLALGLAQAVQAAPPVLWAWERPEDLRFADGQAEVAAQTGFVELTGDRIVARGRRFPLSVAPGQLTTAVVHVQIAHGRPLIWTPAMRRRTAGAVLRFAAAPGVRRVQLDFEARASERPVLLAVLKDLRTGLPAEVSLSMTALAAWCDTERWLDAAPVDEVVPMLFRMGRGGGALKARLAAGGDFANPRCRSAYGVSTDAPLGRAPAGRRVYLFSPRSWTQADFEAVRRRMAGWTGD